MSCEHKNWNVVVGDSGVYESQNRIFRVINGGIDENKEARGPWIVNDGFERENYLSDMTCKDCGICIVESTTVQTDDPDLRHVIDLVRGIM